MCSISAFASFGNPIPVVSSGASYCYRANELYKYREYILYVFAAKIVGVKCLVNFIIFVAEIVKTKATVNFLVFSRLVDPNSCIPGFVYVIDGINFQKFDFLSAMLINRTQTEMANDATRATLLYL